MRYMESFFIHVEPILSEWAQAEGTSPEEILRRLCNFGEDGLVFDDFSFRRSSDKCIIGLAGIRQVAELLGSDNAIRRSDGQKAFEDLQVSNDAVRDFCRATRTRLPDRALVGQSRSAWTTYTHIAPPARRPIPEEFARMEILRASAGPWRAEKRAAASKSLSRARGFPRERTRLWQLLNDLPRLDDNEAIPRGRSTSPHPESSTTDKSTDTHKAPSRPARRWRGYEAQDALLRERVLEIMESQKISCNAAVKQIPDEDIPGTGTPDNRRARLYKGIKKIPNE